MYTGNIEMRVVHPEGAQIRCGGNPQLSRP
jgi:hypothetical protein